MTHRRGIVVLALGVFCVGSPKAHIQPSGTQVSTAEGGLQVYFKHDFDSESHPLTPTQASELALVSDTRRALSGRSLEIRRAHDGGYIGASMPMKVRGSRDLRLAFTVKAELMEHVSVNVFDRGRLDNIAPRSPARIFDSEWHSVVFAVDDFHYNADPPDRRNQSETDLVSVLFHGQENSSRARFWVDKLVAYRGRDDEPPQPPLNVRAVPAPAGAIELNWDEPSDNTFPVVYSIFRKGRTNGWDKIAESLAPRFIDRPAGAASYAYRVTAADFANNVSAPSLEIAGTTNIAAETETPAPPPTHVADRIAYADNVRRVHAHGIASVRRDVYLFAGDSLTAAESYTHALGSWLGRGITVRQGVGTVTSEYGASHIKQYLVDSQPEFAVLMYGTNDVARNAPLSESVRHLAVMIDACVEAGTVPVLATIPPRGFDKNNQQEPQRFNRALVELARKKRIPVSYVFDEIMRHDLRAMLYDGIHLQPQAGNEAVGRSLRETMDQVFFALRDNNGRW